MTQISGSFRKDLKQQVSLSCDEGSAGDPSNDGASITTLEFSGEIEIVGEPRHINKTIVKNIQARPPI